MPKNDEIPDQEQVNQASGFSPEQLKQVEASTFTTKEKLSATLEAVCNTPIPKGVGSHQFTEEDLRLIKEGRELTRKLGTVLIEEGGDYTSATLLTAINSLSMILLDAGLEPIHKRYVMHSLSLNQQVMTMMAAAYLIGDFLKVLTGETEVRDPSTPTN